MKFNNLIILTQIAGCLGGGGFWSSLRATKFGSSLLGPNNNDVSDQNTASTPNNSTNSILGSKFNTIQTNQTYATQFANYSSIAYCNRRSIQKWSCPKCSQYNNDNIEFIKYFKSYKYGNSGYIVVNKDLKQIIISYNSPKATLDWTLETSKNYQKLNLAEEFEGAAVHSGFYQKSAALFNQTFSTMTSLIQKYPAYTIVFTGHSMGGAIAALNAYNLVSQGLLTWDKIALVTFGQPRLGNQQFAHYMNSQNMIIARVNNERDLVPTVPAPPAYYHFGYALYIHLDGNSTDICKPDDFNWKCMTSPTNLNIEDRFNYWSESIDPECK
jgi:hypothetical protein